MSVALLTTAVFVVLVSLTQLMKLDDGLTMTVAVRFVIVVSLASGVVLSLRETRALRRQQYAVPAEALRYKVLAVRVCLIGLLLLSSLFARLFPNWPAQTFNLEYLLLLPLLLLAAPAYVRHVESWMPRPDDGYQRFGELLVRKRRWCWPEQKPLLLAWAVKLLFIPLMYVWLVMTVEHLVLFSWWWNPTTVVIGLFTFGLGIDLLIATAGYIFASRLLGTDIQSTDPHWLGWLACVICYPPLNALLHAIKQQTDDVEWSQWLMPDEPLYWVWAALITGTWGVYWLATIAFGFKFSNLSWRGLVNCGPYRYVKHPAYLSKNIYWWLHTVPFVGTANGLDVLQNCLALSFVSLVYYLRAKTEERHLMRFPEYAAYVARMNEHGVWPRLRRRLLKPAQ